jgi:hypothetical protein
VKNNNINSTTFDSIKIEGGLLTSEVLNRLRFYDLPGQGSADYGIEHGLKLNEELGRYWRIAQARWKKFRDLRQRENIDQHKLTIDEWLIPLLEKVLGYDVSRITGFQKGERYFPIDHITSDNTVPMVLFSAELPLDKGHSHFGEEGRKRSPSGLVQEYLNAEDSCLWALVSNGLTLRLLRDNPAMTRPAYIEVDLERLFEEDLYVDFTVFWLLFHATRVQPQDNLPESCFLEQWREQGQTDGERVRDELRFGVTDALRILGKGFISHPDNNEIRDKIQSGELSTDFFFQELLRLIYRFLFLLTAEDRNVLLDPDSEPAARNLYKKGYSISHLRERSRSRRYYDNHTDVWQQFVITFIGFATGQPLLGQPALGGLFAKEQCIHLEQSKLANRYLFKALYKLSFFVSGKVLVRINYRNMDTEELGSVYESLLELTPKLSVETPWGFSFEGDDEEGIISGHQRKLTGSYYTPDSLVQELIKSALEPVIEQRLQENSANPAQALLDIKVCDPACGSGHFLLAAARRIAIELASIQAGVDQPSDNDYRHALREVVRFCIYGVDINPLSVELCRTALWLETIEPGKPLGFLDAHIQVGNALVGILNPKLIQSGIPNDAFKPLTGDNKQIASALKQRNQIDKNQKSLLGCHNTQLAVCSGGLEVMPEENLAQIERKREAWLELNQDSSCQDEKLRADLFTAAFFAPKIEENIESVPTNVELAALESGEPLTNEIRELVNDLAEQNRFFHWFLAFPEVFESEDGEWGGFDVLLGNPPWERIKLQEKEFFASRSPLITQAKNKAERDQRIKWLSRGRLMAELHPEMTVSNEPDMHEINVNQEFVEARYKAEGASAFARLSGRYPLTGKGDVNLYALFAEHFLNAIELKGRAGFIVPTGISTDDGNKVFFQKLVNGKHLFSLVGFDNQKKIFPSIHSDTPFGLLTLGSNCPIASLIFYALELEHLKDSRRWFKLENEEFSLINPNTLTCPVFRSKQDAELTKKLYRAAPVLIREITDDIPEQNSWGIRFLTMFHMSSDSGLFHTFEDLTSSVVTETGASWQQGDQRLLPLYEAKMVHHYDHRWATFETDGKTSRVCTLEEKQNPYYHNRPRYWMEEWQVTLRTASAPKPVLIAAKEQDMVKLTNALRLWVVGAALLNGDEVTANKLLDIEPTHQKDDLFSTEQTVVASEAKDLASQWPMKEAEYQQLLVLFESDRDNWSLLHKFFEDRRPRYLLGWRDITNATNERTVIAGVISLAAVGNNMPLVFIRSDYSVKYITALQANLCALPLDFVARLKVGGTHLNFFIFKQLPLLSPNQYKQTDLDYIASRVMELTYTCHDIKPFAEELGYKGEPFPFDPERRHHIKCELDAYYAKLYGLTRDELRYILDPADIMGEDYPSETFRVLKNKEIKEFGEYRTQRLVLEAYDKLI